MAKTSELELSDADLELLNSKLGLKHLLATPKVDVEQALKLTKYEIAMRDLQADLVELQNWVIENKQRVVVIFEGRDAAGKGGAIRRITAHINPRHYRTCALSKPSEEERGGWYFQRYVNQLPKPGEMVFFDRSWYNRAVVEPVNGFCTTEEYERFMAQVNGFEKMLADSGAYLIKFFFSIGKKEQARRFAAVKKSPLKRWQMSSVDEDAQRLWKHYGKYEDAMFEQTDSEYAPWVKIDANENTAAHLEALSYLLDTVPYKSD